jgi:hypothetical protein
MSTSTGRSFAVFVRFADEKTARRMTPDGGTTRRRVHAAQIATRERAEQVAVELSDLPRRAPPGQFGLGRPVLTDRLMLAGRAGRPVAT